MQTCTRRPGPAGARRPGSALRGFNGWGIQSDRLFAFPDETCISDALSSAVQLPSSLHLQTLPREGTVKRRRRHTSTSSLSSYTSLSLLLPSLANFLTACSPSSAPLPNRYSQNISGLYLSTHNLLSAADKYLGQPLRPTCHTT
jgi:hypothetical protein